MKPLRQGLLWSNLGRATLMLGVLICSGCGGDTSVYFCSGGVEFCSSFREAVVDAGEPEKPAPALAVARKTPQLIEAGLAEDQLDATLANSPELVGAWLLTSSLGLLVDGGDDESATRFFDETRYWLLYRVVPASADPVLRAGLNATIVVAQQADPAVAAAAAGVLARFEAGGAGQAEAELIITAKSVDAERILSGVDSKHLDDRCCSVGVLAASAVMLCEALAGTRTVIDPRVAQACVVARTWLADLLR